MSYRRPNEKIHNLWLLTAGLAWLVLAGGTPAMAKLNVTPEFRATNTRPMHLAVLPPHADFIKAKAVMTAEMVNECKALEEAAAHYIQSLLTEKGYKVRMVRVEEINADAELRELVHNLNARYEDEWRHIIRRPAKVRTGRYSIGEEAQAVASTLAVDGVVIPRIQAVGVTGGKKALTLLLSLGNVYAQGYARLDLSIVNGQSGNVEAYFVGVKSAGLKALTRKPEPLMGKVTRVTLRKYPGASEELRLSKKEMEQLAAMQEEEEAVDEETILSELELLLGSPESNEKELQKASREDQ